MNRIITKNYIKFYVKNIPKIRYNFFRFSSNDFNKTENKSDNLSEINDSLVKISKELNNQSKNFQSSDSNSQFYELIKTHLSNINTNIYTIKKTNEQIADEIRHFNNTFVVGIGIFMVLYCLKK
jgi:hypothetical protein